MLRRRYRALRRNVPADRDVFRTARIQFRHGCRLRHAGGPGIAADPLEAEIAGSPLARHRDRSGGDLAAASALRRARRSPAHRARRYVLSARWRQGDIERPVDRDHRRMRPPRRPRDREPRGSTADFWNQALSCHSWARVARTLKPYSRSWLWIPGLRLTAHPGMTSRIGSWQSLKRRSPQAATPSKPIAPACWR